MNANLLLDTVFGIQTPAGEFESLSLPTLLAALGDGRIEGFTGVQRHQADAFHIFLCYLAGAVLDQAGESNPLQESGFWLDGIRTLTNRDDDCAWTLIVDDPMKPAFMQPPVTDQAIAKSFKPKAMTPDELDVLQTAKNHDLKGARLAGATVEAWSLSLISMQTMSGFLGKGNYGVSRMNGGFASRPCVATNTDLQPSQRWREDLGRMMGDLASRLRPPWVFKNNGYRLLWLIPWGGKTGLGLSDLHPFFIEICRLVRLHESITGVVASAKPADTARITVSKETAGNVGDPWIPIKRKEQAALTLSGRGFHPALLRDLVITHETYQPSTMQTLIDDGKPAWFHASVLVRGQGITDGFHESHIRIAPKAKRLLLTGGKPKERLAELSEWALTAARDLRLKVLKPALLALLGGGPERVDYNKREAGQWVETWLSRYEQHWADQYFTWLWQTVEMSDDEARATWVRSLRQRAADLLETALVEAPQRTGRRYRAKVRATGLFHGALRKHFSMEMNDVAG